MGRKFQSFMQEPSEPACGCVCVGLVCGGGRHTSSGLSLSEEQVESRLDRTGPDSTRTATDMRRVSATR